jgi:hypothetical protein
MSARKSLHYTTTFEELTVKSVKVRKQWDKAVTWGTCLPAVPFYTTMASITIIFDITM